MVLGRSLEILEIDGEYDYISAGGRDDQGNYVGGPRGGFLLTEDAAASDIELSPDEVPTNAF